MIRPPRNPRRAYDRDGREIAPMMAAYAFRCSWTVSKVSCLTS
jgi:hypothetical protein